MAALIMVGLGIALLGCAWFALSIYRKHQKILARYAQIIDLDTAVAKARDELGEVQRQRQALSSDYAAAKEIFEKLRSEVGLLEGNLEDISFGLYRPHYGFQASDDYKIALENVRDQERALIKDGSAASTPIEWRVGGSAREGARMSKQLTKVMLRAFNGECDAAVAKVAWNNALRMEERIRKAFDQINDLGTVVQVRISREYLDLKIAELRLEHEFVEKKHAEVEEQRRLKEQMREDQRAQAEYEKAQTEAATEEARFEKALEKARAETAKATGERLDKLNERIAMLQHQLAAAQEKRERARSMAEQTRRGFVYIISNIGSFGENVFKIGMTRRLTPEDRVKELGDAAVPFDFDIHAMIPSDDAPTLENLLHKHFTDHRVNLVNPRKEFFRAALEEIEVIARKNNGKDFTLTRLAEARQFRETEAKRAQRKADERRAAVTAPQQFPENI